MTSHGAPFHIHESKWNTNVFLFGNAILDGMSDGCVTPNVVLVHRSVALMNMCSDWISIAVHTFSALAIIHSSQLIGMLPTTTNTILLGMQV